MARGRLYRPDSKRMVMRSTHSGRLERWLGPEKIAHLSAAMRGWHGPPIHLLDLPGSVRVCGDGDFVGPFEHGYAVSALELLWDRYKRAARVNPNVLYAGFANVGDALSRASQGFQQNLNGGQISKTGPTGIAGVTSSIWGLGAQPPAGANASAAPGGDAPTNATTGAMAYTNPATGTLHLVGADMSASIINMCLLVYDRLFHVDKLINSTATEAVTGVPTRYQSQTASDADYIGGNFLFVEVGGTALAAVAHNWTVCLYSDQAGASSTLPSLAGVSGAIVRRLDHPANQFFAPLESGDAGVKALTQMQCSALVTTGVINFVIGHAIGFMSFPIANVTFPFNWLTNRNQAPRIFNNAALALLEVVKPATTPTTYTGSIYATGAAA